VGKHLPSSINMGCCCLLSPWDLPPLKLEGGCSCTATHSTWPWCQALQAKLRSQGTVFYLQRLQHFL
jgi:hypothetical protein